MGDVNLDLPVCAPDDLRLPDNAAIDGGRLADGNPIARAHRHAHHLKRVHIHILPIGVPLAGSASINQHHAAVLEEHRIGVDGVVGIRRACKRSVGIGKLVCIRICIVQHGRCRAPVDAVGAGRIVEMLSELRILEEHQIQIVLHLDDAGIVGALGIAQMCAAPGREEVHRRVVRLDIGVGKVGAVLHRIRVERRDLRHLDRRGSIALADGSCGSLCLVRGIRVRLHRLDKAVETCRISAVLPAALGVIPGAHRAVCIRIGDVGARRDLVGGLRRSNLQHRRRIAQGGVGLPAGVDARHRDAAAHISAALFLQGHGRVEVQRQHRAVADAGGMLILRRDAVVLARAVLPMQTLQRPQQRLVRFGDKPHAVRTLCIHLCAD